MNDLYEKKLLQKFFIETDFSIFYFNVLEPRSFENVNEYEFFKSSSAVGCLGRCFLKKGVIFNKTPRGKAGTITSKFVFISRSINDLL